MLSVRPHTLGLGCLQGRRLLHIWIFSSFYADLPSSWIMLYRWFNDFNSRICFKLKIWFLKVFLLAYNILENMQWKKKNTHPVEADSEMRNFPPCHPLCRTCEKFAFALFAVRARRSLRHPVSSYFAPQTSRIPNIIIYLFKLMRILSLINHSPLISWTSLLWSITTLANSKFNCRRCTCLQVTHEFLEVDPTHCNRPDLKKFGQRL